MTVTELQIDNSFTGNKNMISLYKDLMHLIDKHQSIISEDSNHTIKCHFHDISKSVRAKVLGRNTIEYINDIMDKLAEQIGLLRKITNKKNLSKEENKTVASCLRELINSEIDDFLSGCFDPEKAEDNRLKSVINLLLSIPNTKEKE